MGIGGVRAIRQLGYEPARFHLNEGHAGFLALELLADEVEPGPHSQPGGSGSPRADRVHNPHTRCLPASTASHPS